MRSASRAVLAVAVACGVLAAGCGGSGDDGRLSQAALDRRAAAICEEGQREADRLRREARPGARGEDAAREIDATRQALRTQIDGFAALRGPRSTDLPIAALVRNLRRADGGLETLRDAAVADDLTIDEVIAANPDVVHEVNRSSALAHDRLVALGWFSCVGVVSE